MPEYAALLHHHQKANATDEAPPPSIDEVEAGMLAMARAGIARLN